MRGVLIDYSDALRLVNDEIAKEGYGYIYEQVGIVSGLGSCVNVVAYSDDTIEGSCLVGRALIAAGIDPRRFVDANCVDGDVYDVLHSLSELGMTRKAMSFFQAVQARQDNGNEWGDAVDSAVVHVHDCVDGELDDVNFL